MFRTSLRPTYLMGSLIVILLGITAGGGLLMPEIYRPFLKTEALLPGLLVQDLVSLLVAPLLIGAMIATRRGSLRALVMWAGLLVYVGYYYAFYSFGYLYTVFYPLYLALMALALYSLIGLLATIDAQVFARHVGPHMPVRRLSVVLGMTLLFVPIWLVRLFQGIHTQQVHEADLVFVLDLAILIPAMLFAAVQLWRRRPVGYLLGGVLLVKTPISGILLTGGSLRQLQLGFEVAPEELAMYIFLALVGMWSLLLYMRHLQAAAPRQIERRQVDLTTPANV
jgi:hypothetical protein